MNDARVQNLIVAYVLVLSSSFVSLPAFSNQAGRPCNAESETNHMGIMGNMMNKGHMGMMGNMMEEGHMRMMGDMMQESHMGMMDKHNRLGLSDDQVQLGKMKLQWRGMMQNQGAETD